MEDEFLKMQKLELSLTGDDNETKKAIKKYMTSASFYNGGKKYDQLIDELDEIIAKIAEKGITRGRVMSIKTMNEYLSKEERTMHTQRILDMIDRSNSKRASNRLKLYGLELEKELNYLKGDIKTNWIRLEQAGFNEREILKQFVEAAETDSGVYGQFYKSVQSIERDALRREAALSEMEEYSKVAGPDELWQWITISVNPCPDCQIRAGVTLPLEEWKEQGLPGEGRTVCRTSCMCKLIPENIAEDLFPDVKTFEWNKNDGVLTTRGEMKTFKTNAE